MPTSIARRYARALYQVSTEAGEVEAALTAIEGLAELFNQAADLRILLSSPGISRAQRRAVLTEIAKKGGFSKLFTNFLCLLVDRDRASELPMISILYRELADEGAGRLRAEVVTALPLEDAQEQALASALKKATGKTILLTSEADADLIGGVKAQVGDTLFDGSLKLQLARLRERALA